MLNFGRLCVLVLSNPLADLQEHFVFGRSGGRCRCAGRDGRCGRHFAGLGQSLAADQAGGQPDQRTGQRLPEIDTQRSAQHLHEYS